jgi:hypothetical protein
MVNVIFIALRKRKEEKKEESYLPGRKPCGRGALARASPPW